MESPEQLIKDDAFEDAITRLIQIHRTEFEQLMDTACADRGIRYNSAWLKRYIKGMV